MPRSHQGRDLYAVLGVQPSASAGQITAAYRALVRALHPDTAPAPSPTPDPASVARAPAAGEELAEVLIAYATLRDPRRRAAYDADRDSRGERGRGVSTGVPVPVRVRGARDRLGGAPLRAGPVRVEPLMWPDGRAEGKEARP